MMMEALDYASEPAPETCASCFEAVAPDQELCFEFGSEIFVCWDCALDRGGSYSVEDECWIREPRMDDLLGLADASR